MARYLLKRLGQSLVVLFILSVSVFLLLSLLPGDPVYAMLGDGITPETYQITYHELDLDLLITDRVSAAELAEAAGLCHAYRYGAAYAADHAFAMSYDFAYMLRNMLGVQANLSDEEAYRLEAEIFEQQRLDHGFDKAKTRLEQVWQWSLVV